MTRYFAGNEAREAPESQIMNILKSTLLSTALVAAGTAPVFAADTTTFNVEIVILKACDVDAAAATDVDFGDVASTAVNTDNAGSLSVLCTPLTPYNISLDNGENGASIATRSMTDSTTLVPYQLYRAAARGAGDVWGATVGTDTYSSIGTGLVQVVPVYGRVPSANFPAGSYNDVVTATIIY
jgi:outer membrane usher protein